MSQLMRLWYLSYRRTVKGQARLRICAVMPEPSLFAYIKYGSRRRVWPKIRRVAPVDCCARMFEDEFTEGHNCHNLMRRLKYLWQFLQKPTILALLDGCMSQGFTSLSTVFQSFRNDGWTWKTPRNEVPFSFGKNLASSGIWTREPTIRCQEHSTGREPNKIMSNYLSQSMTKPTKWPVHPAKTQIRAISLRLERVWVLSYPYDKEYSKDSD